MKLFDQHTHNAKTIPGAGVVNLPMGVLSEPESFHPTAGQLYSAGIFPLYEGDWDRALENLKKLIQHPQLVALGECGLDKRSNVPFLKQENFFEAQVILADQMKKHLIIHCVRAWRELFVINRLHPTEQRRIVHGFRGKPELACQLIETGFYLSFGPLFNADSLRLCAPERRLIETDDSNLTLMQVNTLQHEAFNIPN